MAATRESLGHPSEEERRCVRTLGRSAALLARPGAHRGCLQRQHLEPRRVIGRRRTIGLGRRGREPGRLGGRRRVGRSERAHRPGLDRQARRRRGPLVLLPRHRRRARAGRGRAAGRRRVQRREPRHPPDLRGLHLQRRPRRARRPARLRHRPRHRRSGRHRRRRTRSTASGSTSSRSSTRPAST